MVSGLLIEMKLLWGMIKMIKMELVVMAAQSYELNHLIIHFKKVNFMV